MASSPFYQPGQYVAEVTQQALGEAGTGTPQFVLRVKILGRPDPAEPDSYVPVQQYERTIYRAITENTIDYVMEDLKTLGFAGNSFSDLDPASPNHQSFAGKQIDVYCKHEDDQKGNTREKWGLSGRQKALEVKPLDSKKTRSLDSLFGKNLKTIAQTAKPAAVQRSVAVADNPHGITDDDVPF
jgi:hypothetical protein